MIRRFGALLTIFMLLLPAAAVKAEVIGSGVLITELMSGSTASANTEFVELYNQSNQDVDITGWKLQYFSATGTSATTKATLSGMLKAKGFLLAGTADFKTEFNLSFLDATFSAGFSDSAGRVRIIDANSNVIDSVSWGSSSTSSEGMPAASLTRSQSLKRRVNGDAAFIDDNNNASDFSLSATPFPQGGDVYEVAPPAPDPVSPADSQTPALPLTITELLPDAVGSDSGNEFIELYNPNDSPVALKDYSFQIGPNFEAKVNLPGEIEISPHQYLALYNNHPSFTLVNTTSRVRLLAPDGSVLNETPGYNDPAEGQSWALIDGGWQATAKPTPDGENELVVLSADTTDASTELEPCAPGKFRNPETNRCKTIEDDSLAVCSAGQERNPDTNRCRKVTSSDLAPCQPGQERNPATNRCRKAGTDEDQLAPCQPGYERNPDTNRCRKVIATTDPKLAAASQVSAINPIQLNARILAIVLAVALGYGAYEYRIDLKNFWDKLRTNKKA